MGEKSGKIYDLSADRWNELLSEAGKGHSIEKSGLTLSEDEKELYSSLLEERAEHIKKHPGIPFSFAPVEKDWD